MSCEYCGVESEGDVCEDCRKDAEAFRDKAADRSP